MSQPDQPSLFARLQAIRTRIAASLRADPQRTRAVLAVEPMEDRTVPATVSGTAWFDANANGAWDTGEAAAAGVGVTITPLGGMGGSSASTQTGSGGLFSFGGVSPGSYAVAVIAPSGHTATAPAMITVGSDVSFGIAVSGSGSSSGSGSGSGSSSGSGSPAAVQFGSGAQTVSEGSSGSISISRTGDTSQGLSVQLQFGPDGVPDPLASWGTDFRLYGPLGELFPDTYNQVSLSFAPNQSQLSLNFTTLSNGTLDPTRGFRLSVVGGTGYTSGTVPAIDIRIPDDGHRLTAVDDVTATHGLTPVQIAVLGNDTDSAGHPLTVTEWTQPAGGTLAFDPATSVFTFTPSSRLATGNTTFSYTISDGHGATASAPVTVQRVFWISPVGGSWADPANWNAGLIPTREDDVVIALPSTETVTVPAGFAAEIHSLTCSARLDVAGSLLITGDSEVTGALNVEGSGALNVQVPDVIPPANPGDELALLSYLGTPHGLVLRGGGDVAGQINTIAGSQTVVGSNELRLGGTGALNGDGWYSIGLATLSFNGAAATVSRLFAGTGSVVGGSADLTLTTSFIAQGATFSGLDGTSLFNLGYGYVRAPVPPGSGAALELNGRTIENGATLDVADGTVQVAQGYGIRNRADGTIRLNDKSRITKGAQAGANAALTNEGLIDAVSGPGEWAATIELPVVNAGGLINVPGSLNITSLTQQDANSSIVLGFEVSALQIATATLTDGSIQGPGTVRIGREDGTVAGFLDWRDNLEITSIDLYISKGSRAVVLNGSLVESNLFNQGTTTIRGTLSLFDATVRNLADARLELIATTQGGTTSGIVKGAAVLPPGAIPGWVYNAGTLVAGSSQFFPQTSTIFTTTISVRLANDSVVSVARGDLVLEAGLSNQGTLVTNPVQGMSKPFSTITFNYAFSYTFFQGTNIVGPGTIVADQSAVLTNPGIDVRFPARFELSGKFTQLVSTNGTGTFSAAYFVWRAGTITNQTTVRVDAGATLEIAATLPNATTAGRLLSNATISNQGQVLWTGTGDVGMANNARWVNDGWVSIQVAGVGIARDLAPGAPPAGTVEMRPGSMWFLGPQAGANFVSVPFTNAGGEVQLRGMTFGAGYTQTSGTSLLGPGSASVTGTVSITGGALDLGTGLLSVTGAVTLGANATLRATVTDAGPGQINASGAVMLGGTLTLDQALTQAPPVGTSYRLLTTATNFNGNFTAFNGVTIGNSGRRLAADQTDPMAFNLVVENVP